MKTLAKKVDQIVYDIPKGVMFAILGIFIIIIIFALKRK